MTHDDTLLNGDAPASDGRVPGARGRATREKLLDATLQMLDNGSYRDLTVADIAREVGTSPATFYSYFGDVEEAVLFLAHRMVDDATDLTAPLEAGEWSGPAAVDSAAELVDAFIDFWRSHAPVMRVVDLAIVEGDQRFRDIRNDVLAPPSKHLRKAIQAAQQSGAHPASVDPRAQAGVLVSMLAHVAEHRQGNEQWGVGEKAAKDSMTRIIVWSVTGKDPVAG